LNDAFPSLLVKDASRISLGEVAEVSVCSSPTPTADVPILADSTVAFEIVPIPDGLEHWMVMPNIQEIVSDYVAQDDRDEHAWFYVTVRFNGTIESGCPAPSNEF
jgi:hypothetical protein